MGLLDDIGAALDRPWAGSGATPEQINPNPWARRGLVVSALGNSFIPPWEQGHKDFGTTIAAHGELARKRTYEDEKRAFELQNARDEAESNAAIARYTQGQAGPQAGPAAGPQAALGAPGLGPPGPTMQRAAAIPQQQPATPDSERKNRAERYRGVAHMLLTLKKPNLTKAKEYFELADKLDPREEFMAPIETAGGLVQPSKWGTAPRELGLKGKPPDLPSDVRTLEHVLGTPLAGAGQPGLDVLKDYRKSGASSQNVNVGENALAKALGELTGKQLDAAFTEAKAAIPAIDTAHRIRQAVDSGKVITGPGATFRVFGLQLGQTLGVGGKTSEDVLLNTRSAIQNLAKAELAAAGQMKGQGQITEFERGILLRAESGKVDDMTAPELRQLSEVMERGARYRISLHQQTVNQMKKKPELTPFVPLYNQIEAPPVYAPPPAAKVPKVHQVPGVPVWNPSTRRLEYGPAR